MLLKLTLSKKLRLFSYAITQVLQLVLVMVERVMGIEPTSSAWEAEVLPLNNTRFAQNRIIILRQNLDNSPEYPAI